MFINKLFKKNEIEGKILILEDGSKNSSFLHNILNKKYEVLMASEKDIAYKIAVNSKPDLIILPSKIIGNKTLDLCINLKSDDQTKKIPILVIADNGSHISEFYFQRVEGYLIKPFNQSVLLNCADSLIRGARFMDRQFYQLEGVQNTYAKVNFYRNSSL